jgi:ATP-dependent protease HslVU (ClpYQ) peptidase subunit
MTLIIGYVDKEKSYIASDSMGSNGYTGAIYKNKKVFRIGTEILAGGCGSYKELQLLEKDFEAPKRNIGESTSDYMYNQFAHALKEHFKKHEVLRSKEGVLDNHRSEFIFICGGNIYRWQSDLALLETVLPYDTTGSGAVYAHAVMTTLESIKSELSVKDKLKTAIKLTSDYVVSVGGAPEILEMENSQCSA